MARPWVRMRVSPHSNARHFAGPVQIIFRFELCDFELKRFDCITYAEQSRHDNDRETRNIVRALLRRYRDQHLSLLLLVKHSKSCVCPRTRPMFKGLPSSHKVDAFRADSVDLQPTQCCVHSKPGHSVLVLVGLHGHCLLLPVKCTFCLTRFHVYTPRLDSP